MSMWVKSDGEPLLLRWDVLFGIELVVFRLGGRLDIFYMLGCDENEWVLRTDNAEDLAIYRARLGFAFTRGEA
jgi:hypothetical protein